jgi:leucine dehydrogenase
MNAAFTTGKELQKWIPFLVNYHLMITNKLFCNDKDTGLKAIIGIHNSVMGPALGGTRMFNYANEWKH